MCDILKLKRGNFALHTSCTVMSAYGLVRSVDSEGFAKVARLLNEVDHVGLLLEEDGEEVSVV